MILKLQQGGVAAPPLVSYQPVMISGNDTNTGTTDTTNKTTKTSDLTDKDLLQMLDKLNGLPNDMQLLTKQLQDFYIDQQYDIFPNTSNIASRYLSILSYMKVANFNKNQYDAAYQKASDSGRISEYAINSRGQVFCVNADKDYKLLRPEELIQQTEYVPLTNSDLLELRAYDPKLANNSELVKIISNSIGMKDIQDLISNIISNIGTTKSSTEGYSTRENGQILKGIDILKNASQNNLIYNDVSNMSIDGLYKNQLITEDQVEQSYAALNYIYNILPENAKSLLKLKSNGTSKGVESLLIQLINSRNSITRSFKTDLQENLNADGSKKVTQKEKEEQDKSKINPAVAFQRDMGAETRLTINGGTSDAISVQAYRMPVVTKEGKNLGLTTLDKVASDSVYGGIFDFSNVTMGDKTLDMASSQNIVVDTSSIYKVYLPVDMKKYAKGIIAPGVDYLPLLELVRQDIKDSGASTPEEINKIYQEYDLPKFIDENGNINEEFYKPFGVLNATALSDAFEKDTNLFGNNNFEEVTDKNIIQNYWKILKGVDTKEKFDSKGVLNYLGMGSYQQLFKGLVYLPLNSIDPTLGAYSGGDTPSETIIYNNKSAMQQQQRISNYKPQGNLQL